MKTSFFEKNILVFFKKHGRHDLPWRKKGITAYEVWVSEIMLQQTQVSRVIPYYSRFLGRFPTVFDLAKTSWEIFLPYYAGLGYYRRGRNMLETARQVVSDYGGIFPKDKALLHLLPGIGEYTASAIMSFAYGKKQLAFDTNLQKVLGRFFYGTRTADVDQSIFAKSLKADRKILNAAIMDFANAVCLRRPKCEVCPLQKECKYFKTEGGYEASLKNEKTAFSSKDAQVFLWLHKDHKEYYSQDPDTFRPFVFSPQNNSREKIKEYFRKEYGLEVAVRPPRKKVMVKEKPTMLVNAQILSGRHEFGVFRKEDVSLN